MASRKSDHQMGGHAGYLVADLPFDADDADEGGGETHSENDLADSGPGLKEIFKYG